MPSRKLYLLGTPRIEEDGKPLSISRRKTVALLAYLAATNQPHNRDFLATLFWPEYDQAGARANLRRDLSRLKNALGADALLVNRSQAGINPEAGWELDIAAFQAAADLVRAHDHFPDTDCSDCLHAAADATTLYTADFMVGFSLPDCPEFDDWQFFQADGCRQTLADLLHRLLDWHTKQQEYERAIEYGRRWLALDTMHEEAHRQLMRLYAWSGQNAAALRQYDECVRILDEELGVEPEPETTELYEQIRARRLEMPEVIQVEETAVSPQPAPPPIPTTSTTGTAVPVLPAQSDIPNNLPLTPTSFIARPDELNQIQRLLVEEQACRLLTLVGAGGIGKTRLALEAGAQLLPHYPDGVYFASLAGLTGPEFIVPALAEILPLQFSGAATPKAQLIHFLRPKHMLLILDNFEHLLGGIDLLAEILRLAPCVSILVTSWERLRLQEEWSLQINGLAFPAADSSLEPAMIHNFGAIQLFSQRARRVRASFSLSGGSEKNAVRICHLLQGIPLAIELVAPHIRQKSCHDIAEELKQILADDTLDAQQRVWRVLDQVWQELSREQQAVLARLSVFQGGWQRDAAVAVTGASLSVLAKLVDNALVQQDGNGRYSLHRLVRQFAHEKLKASITEQEAALDAHSSTYLDFLARRTARIKGEKQSRILNEISADLDNIRVAWRRGVARRQLTALLAAAECLWLFSEFRGILHEGENAFRHALDHLSPLAGRDDVTATLLGYLRAGQGSLMARRGWLVEGIPQIEMGLASLQQPEIPNMQKVAFVQMWLAFALVKQGQYEKARQHAQESLTYFPETYDYWIKAGSLRLLGTASLFQGDLQEAEALFQDCLNTCVQISEQRIQTVARADLGVIAMMRGDNGRSQQWFDEAMELSRQSGDRLVRVQLLRDQGILAIHQGRYEQAANLLEQSKAISTEIGRPIAGKITCAQGVVFYRQGNASEARAHFQNGLAAAKAMGNQTGVAFCLQQLALLACDEGLPDHAEQLLEDAYAIWQDIDNEPMMADIDCSLGHVLSVAGANRRQDAKRHFYTALSTAHTYDLAPVALDALTGLAGFVLATGETETAVPALQFIVQCPSCSIVAKERAYKLLETVPEAERQQAITYHGWCELAEAWLAYQKEEAPSDSVVGNLPVQTAPFIGRDNDLAALQTSLIDEKARLITILGPGGIGKTRLSIATAESVSPHFKNGVHYVPLVPLESADNLLTAVAEAVNFHLTPTEDSVQQLLDYLHKKQLLLVFDNFEHLLPHTVLIDAILKGVPEAQILVTSRKRLNVHGEVVYPLGGLAFPKKMPEKPQQIGQYGAAELFMLHVQTGQSLHKLTKDEAGALLKICELVQGMPLALILAAGWADMLSFTEIAEEISSSLDFLESERHDLPERQRSVRAVFDGSWQQLSADVQQAFARLSVFRSGFTRQAGQAVAGANLRTLRRLVNHSFISMGENGRYQIHELMRQYGEEHLRASGQFEETRTAHSDYFLKFLAEREPDVRGRRQEEAMLEIDAEFENVLSAWRWGCAHQNREGIDSALETIHLFCDMFGRYQDGTLLLEQAMAHLTPDTEPDLSYGRMLTRHAFMQIFFPTKWDAAMAELKQAMPILEKYEAKAEIALNHLAQASFVFTMQEDPESSKVHYQQALAIYEELGDDFYRARTLISMSFCFAVLGQLEESLKVVEDGLVFARKSGSKAELAYASTNLAEHDLGMGDYDKAASHFKSAISSAEFVQNSVILSYSQALLGFIVWQKGDIEEAKQLLKESLRMAEDMNHAITICYAQSILSLWAALTDDQAAARHWAQSGFDNPANNTIGLIIAQMGLAIVYCNLGRWDDVRGALKVALAEAEAVNYPAPPLWLLPITAVLVAHEGDYAKAVALLAFASQHPLSETGWISHWSMMTDLQAQLGEKLSLSEYGAAWVNGEMMVTEMDGETAVAFVRSQLDN